MSGNLILVYVKETGHILAALSGAADFGENIKADALTGESLLVRYAGNTTAAATGFDDGEFFVPTEQLDVFPTEYNANTIARPRDSYVKTEPEPKSVQPLNLLDAPTITDPLASDTQVIVTVPVGVPDDTKVWVQLVGPDPEDTQVKTGKVTGGAATINVDRLKPATDYFVLVLVAGLEIQTLKTTTP